MIGYQTAWLKVYYPVEFMAALLTSVMDGTVKVAEYIQECKKMGIHLLPPDINEGYARFSVSQGGIRFGLAAIKNVGRGVIESLVTEREKGGPFQSLTDFLQRMDSRELNKRCLESLIKGGAFDSLGGRRAQYMKAYGGIFSSLAQNKKKNIEGQLSLFDLEEPEEIGGQKGSKAQVEEHLPSCQEYPLRDLLLYEKEVLGLYISGHPLSAYEKELQKQVTAYSSDFAVGHKEAPSEGKIYDGKAVTVGGLLVAKTIKYTKNNQAMAFLTLEDLYGSVEIILFSNLFEKYDRHLTEDQVLFIHGKASVREDENAKIICQEIQFFEELPSASTLWLKLSKDRILDLEALMDLLQKHAGKTPVILYDEAKKRKITLAETHWVTPTDDLTQALCALLGAENLRLRKDC